MTLLGREMRPTGSTVTLVRAIQRRGTCCGFPGSFFVISRSRIGWFVLMVVGIIIAALGSVALT
jgi:hypothetical protein